MLNQKGIIYPLIFLLIIAVVGTISFLLLSSVAPFNGGPFSKLNPKPFSHAATCQGVQVSAPNGLTAALINSSPTGTTFCLGTGTFAMTKSILLKTGDQIIGTSQTGTILDFSTNSLDSQNGYSYGIYGFSGSQDNVTVSNLTVQNCHTSTNTCIALKEGENWTVTDVELRQNDVGLSGSCTKCYIHHNTVYGVNGAKVIENSELAFNGGTPDSGGSTGGSKSVQLTNMTWRGNYVHDNRGPGIWCDACSKGSKILIENNRIESNSGPGIEFEITWGTFDCPSCGTGLAIARDNNLKGNDTDNLGKSCFWGGQIFIHNSIGIQVTGNTIDSSGGTNALCVTDTTRSETLPTYPEYVAPFNATGNTITLKGSALVGESGYQGGYQLDSSTFVVKNNIYNVDSLAIPHWSWYQNNSNLTFAQWQGYGMDTGSRITSLCPKDLLGDLNCDSLINLFDYNILLTNFGKTGTGLQGDLDDDSKVGIFDYNTLVTNFGK